MKIRQSILKSVCASKLWLTVSCILFTAGVGTSYAAEIEMKSVSRSNVQRNVAMIKGQIMPGDARKLVNLMVVNSDKYLPVVLDSTGGDVVEAIRMGVVIKTLRLPTRVENGGVCASACFFIWMAGSSRLASGFPRPTRFGRIGLHRPFLRTPDNSETSLAVQANVMRGVTSYLEANLVSRRLIDLMMNRPSNDIYWLNNDDIAEIGDVPPDLEELYIAKCRYDRRRIGQYVEAEAKRDFRLLGEIEAKDNEIVKCTSDLDFSVYQAGMDKLLTGWLPPNPFQVQTKKDVKQSDISEERKIEQVHPGWKELVITGAFTRWRNAQSANIQELGASEKAADAIRMLDLYKNDLRNGK